MILDGMILDDIGWYWLVLDGIDWPWVVLNVTGWYWINHELIN